jgi:hypothetical protein
MDAVARVSFSEDADLGRRPSRRWKPSANVATRAVGLEATVLPVRRRRRKVL